VITRDILRDALKHEDAPGSGLETEIAALFSETGLEKDIPEIRGHLVTPQPSSHDSARYQRPVCAYAPKA
jgi:hypothetical protein